jgi:hypothetical protein
VSSTATTSQAFRRSTGARQQDRYEAAASNNTLATASDITSTINTGTLQGVITGLDITSTSDVDYYKFNFPNPCSNVINVTIRSDHVSLLAPAIFILNSSGTVLASLTATGQYGSTQTVTWNGDYPGQTYYIKVSGADSTVFGTGAYNMGVSLSGAPVASVPGVYQSVLNGSPLQNGGGRAIVVNSETLVNTTTAGQQITSPNRDAVAINSAGNFVVTWSSAGQDGNRPGHRGSRVRGRQQQCTEPGSRNRWHGLAALRFGAARGRWTW